MNIKKVKLKDLKFPEYNPRKKLKPGDAEYEKIKNSIENFGYVEPVIINKDKTIIGGNQRSSILIDLGYEEIDVVTVDLPKEKEKALNIALNKLSGEWDFEKLTNLLDEIRIDNVDNFDLTGFDTKEFDKLMNEFDVNSGNDSSSGGDDNFNVNESLKEIVEPVTRIGDIYILGNHILMCGDSFNEKHREKLLRDRIDMVFTDPPYDMQMGGQGCFAESTKKIKKRIDNLINFDVMKLQFMNELKIPSFYIFTSKEGIKKYFNIFDEFNYNILVWGKTNAIPFNSNSFTPDLEYLLYFHSKEIKRIWNNSLKPADIYKKYYISSIQHAKKEEGEDLHPTMKPLELISNRIKISSNKGGNVLDLFGGSGSTLIACEQTERKCLMMEIDPVYCDIIIKRYIKYKNDDNSDVFLINDNKKISWSEISKYRPVRKV